MYAKEVLGKAKRIRLPTVVSTKTVVQEEVDWHFDTAYEEVMMENMRPDIVLVKGEVKLLVEIVVTNESSPEKIALLQDRNLPALEIYLDSDDIWQFDRDEIKGLVLDETANKSWIHNRKKKEWEDAQAKKAEAQARRAAEKAKQEEERKVRIAESKLERIQRALDPAIENENRRKWAAELPDNPRWKNISRQLGISLSTVPAYLNTPILGDSVFACDRRLWQGLLFRLMICPRKKPFDSNVFGVKGLIQLVKQRSSDFCLNWELVNAYQVMDNAPAGLAEVLGEYMLILERHGYVEAMPYNGDHPYGWGFCRTEWQGIILDTESEG